MVGAIVGCGDPRQRPSAPLTWNEHAPDQETWGATIYLFQEGQRRVVVTATHITRYLKSKQTTLDQGIRIEFYDQDGQQASTLTADRGMLDEQSQDMIASGHVVVVSHRGGKLETDSLRWVENTNRIRTESPVRISTEKDTITGIGFEADPNLDHWEITRNVQGRFDRGDEIEKVLDSPEE